MLVLIVSLLLNAALAAVNGAKYVSKGVATLAGRNVARCRGVVVWGAVTPLVAGATARAGYVVAARLV